MPKLIIFYARPPFTLAFLLPPIFRWSYLKKWVFFMRRTGLAKTIIISVLFLLSAVIFIETTPAAEPFFQKGICYVTWEKERYASAHSDKSLEMLAQTGAEWVQIVTTYYQDNYDTKRIFPTEKTPSDKSLIHVIRRAHQLGIKVMLKPHIDLLNESDGLYRGDIGFQTETDWQAWFLEYQNFILHYARLAQESGVELFSIGTELCFASQKTSFWQEDIIPQIRKVYKGKLTYAANWDEYKNVCFWDALDYVGIDAYFPLTKKSNPDYAEIKAGWIKWADEIEEWQKRINKPIIFSEIGYRSCAFAAATPWEYSSSEGLNLEIQADCYKAALEVLSQRLWCKGLYWWYWKPSVYAGGPANRDFIPQNKPAETVLTYYYRGLSFAKLSQ